MGQDSTNNTTGGQTGGQTGAQGGADQTQPQTTNTGEDRSFQGGGGDAVDGGRVDTDGDGRTRDPNDTRPTDNGGQDAPVQR